MKLKFSISEAFRDRKFKYGGTATILVICVVVATLIVNLLCGLIPYKLDITANKFFSISTKTLSVLSRVDKDIDIYFLYPAGNEDDTVMELVNRYTNASSHIRAQAVDPIANPKFAEQYKADDDKASSAPVSGNVIVECKDTGKFAVLTSEDLYTYNYDDDGNLTSAYFEAEQAFTSAISAVTNDKTYNIALLKGHGEAAMPEIMLDALEGMFFNVFDLDLQEAKEIPTDTDVLVVLTPEFDLREEEKDIIMDYLDATDTAGNAIFIMGKSDAEMTNFDKVMAYYAIELRDEVIYEEDSTKYVGGMKYALMIKQESIEATRYVNSTQKLYLQDAKPIRDKGERMNNIKLEYVVRTSKDSWATLEDKNSPFEFDPETDTPAGDGFIPAVAITEYGNPDQSVYSRLFIMNCENFMLGSRADLNSYSNDEVFYSAVAWCLDSQSAMVTITPKYYITATHKMASGGVYAFAIVLGIILPVTVLGSGLVVYLKRRHL